MNFFKKSAALTFGLFLIVGTVFAQGQQMMKSGQADDVSDEELKNFVNVVKGFQQVSLESQKNVKAVLADKDMDMMRLRKIMISKSNPKMADSVNVTDKEKKELKEIKPKLKKIQRKSQKEKAKVIKDNGLTIKRFQVIRRSIQTDSTLAKKFQNELRKAAQDSMKK